MYSSILYLSYFLPSAVALGNFFVVFCDFFEEGIE